VNERLEYRPSEFVGVAGPHYIYIGIKDRADFDKIDRPVEDRGQNEYGHVLIKTVEQGEVTVIFQFWLLSETTEAFLERCRRERAERQAAGGAS
jgi:hypothetical protein